MSFSNKAEGAQVGPSQCSLDVTTGSFDLSPPCSSLSFQLSQPPSVGFSGSLPVTQARFLDLTLAIPTGSVHYPLHPHRNHRGHGGTTSCSGDGHGPQLSPTQAHLESTLHSASRLGKDRTLLPTPGPAGVSFLARLSQAA